MPDLIQVADDLKNMPDAWLAQQMQSPTGSVPPWLVASEVQRRQKLRSGAAQAQAPQSSVSQDLIRSLFAKIPPTAGLMPPGQQGQAPPGMPPVNLTPGGGSGALGSPPPGTPPANLRMPARTMAAGGSFDDEEEPEEESPAPDDSIAQLVQAASQKHGIAPEVLQSQIRSESNGRVRAVSPKGARGLMQIMPDTAAEMGVKDPALLDDPAVNIDTGARYLRKLLDKYGDLPTALAAYNAGPGAVDKYKGIPPFRETVGYVNKTMGTINGIRKSLNLPPLEQVPTDFRSRLLKPTPAPEAVAPSSSPTPFADQFPGGVAMAPAQAAPQPQIPADVVDSAAAPAPAPDAAPDAVAPPAAAALAAPPAAEPDAVVKPAGQSGPMTDIARQMEDMKKGHVSVEDRQRDLYKQENLNLLESAAKTFFGKQQDPTKYQQAIDSVMAMAQKNMHPSIGQALMQFGLALMANKSHYFGVAVGEAGSQAFAAMNQMKHQGMQDYLTAAKAGVELQDKANEYNAKLGQYKMQRLGAQQTGVLQDERNYQTQLAALQRQYNTAAIAFQKQIGAAAKTIQIPQQQMDTAVRKTAEKYSLPVPPDRVATAMDLPSQHRDEAMKLYSDYVAQKTIAVQEGIADKVTSHLDPEYVGMSIAQTGALPSNFPRSPIAVAKAWQIGTDWLKKNGFTAQAAVAERSAIKANQGALAQMTKMHESVEAFSQTTAANMGILEDAMAQVRDYGAPVFNTPMRDLARQWKGDPKVAALEAALKSVQSEVGKVLNSATLSGAITQAERDDIASKLGPGATAAMMKATLDVWRKEMTNRRETYAAQVKDLQQRTVFGQTGASGTVTRQYNGHTYRKEGNNWVLVQ